MMITTLTYQKPKWWQFIKRFRVWRSFRNVIGKKLVLNGQVRRIVDYRNATITIDKPFEKVSGNDNLFLIQ